MQQAPSGNGGGTDYSSLFRPSTILKSPNTSSFTFTLAFHELSPDRRLLWSYTANCCRINTGKHSASGFPGKLLVLRLAIDIQHSVPHINMHTRMWYCMHTSRHGKIGATHLRTWIDRFHALPPSHAGSWMAAQTACHNTVLIRFSSFLLVEDTLPTRMAIS